MMEEHEIRVACGMIEESRCLGPIVAEECESEADRTKLRLGEREAIKVRCTVWEWLTC